jgi:hypothetical protein
MPGGPAMKKHIAVCILIFVSIQFVYAQKMTVKDSDTNILLEVNDEGSIGSITLPIIYEAPGSETNKLYNLAGSLIWDGSALSTGSSSGGWTDDGTVIRLTTGTDKVGIGDSSPTHILDVAGKIGINDTQILYLPDQTNYTGTLYLSDGGGSLSHSSGDQGRYNTGVGIGALNAQCRRV